MRQPAGNAAEARADRLHRQFENHHCRGSQQQRHDRSGDAIRNAAAQENNQNGEQRQHRRGGRKSVKASGQRPQPHRKYIRHFRQLQTEKIFHLRAGNQNGDAVGEADHDRPGNKFDRRAQPGEAHDDQQHSGHHGAEKKPVDAVHGNDSRQRPPRTRRSARRSASSIRPAPKSKIR